MVPAILDIVSWAGRVWSQACLPAAAIYIVMIRARKHVRQTAR
eukprot:COSAG01_NODE_34237_length_551_cov_0.665929_1_plen_42_part_10